MADRRNNAERPGFAAYRQQTHSLWPLAWPSSRNLEV